MATINWYEISIFDYSIAGILTIFLLRGLCIGFVRQLADAAALIGSCWLAGAYAGQVMPLARHYLPLPEELVSQPAVMFWLSLGGIYLLVMLVCTLISKLLDVKVFGWTDRMAGGLLSLARGAFITMLLFMLMATVLPARHPLFEASLTAPYLSQGAESIRQFIHDAKIRDDLQPRSEETAQQPDPVPPAPADGTLVAPDLIPDQGETQQPPAPEDNRPEGDKDGAKEAY